MGRNKVPIGIAGEYYVLAELARRDAVACMTIGNTKAVDILVAHLGQRQAFKVEVKTATKNPSKVESRFISKKRALL